MGWFTLALLAPLILALVVIIDDNLVRHVYKSPFYGTIISGIFGLLPLISLFFIDLAVPSALTIAIGILAGFLTVSYYFFYFKALKVEAPSVVIALFSLAPAVVSVLAYLILGEKLSGMQYLGISIIILAAFGISANDIRKWKFSRALGLIAMASVLFAVSLIAIKHVFEIVDFWSGYVYLAIGMGLASLFFATAFKGGRSFVSKFRKNYRKWLLFFAITEGLNIVAELTQKLAISNGPVSLVTVLGNVLPIYILILAIILYRFFPNYLREATEGHVLKKLIFMAIMLSGIILLNPTN